MTSIADLAKIMQQVFIKRANEVAVQSGFMKRERVLSGSSFVVGLVSGWQADPASSLSGLAQAVGNAGTPVTRQGINQRFDASAARLLRAMGEVCVEQMVSGLPVEQEVLRRFTDVDLVDSTVVTLPNEMAKVWRGSGGYGANASRAAVKVSVRWNMVGGQLRQINLTDGVAHDRAAAAHHAPSAAGSLQLRDLGYHKLDDLEKIGQQGAYWLIKYKVGTHLYTPDGSRLNLLEWLPSAVGTRVDTRVCVGQRKRLPARLVAERVPQPVVAQRHERIRETARQNQTSPSHQALALAHWTLYLTNTSPALLSTQQVFVMGRYRWQIELLFKLWKSDLLIDQWRSANPHRILCELYAKLIVAIVTHWFLLISVWPSPRRSLRQAIPTIRHLAWQWANSLSSSSLLIHTLHALQRALLTCRLEPSQLYPRPYQLLLASVP
jgi:hypothetical protein